MIKILFIYVHLKGNRGVFIESNIHAREWITSATVTYLINELLTNTDDQEIMDIARNVDWYILPLANVDGFQYSHQTVNDFGSLIENLLYSFKLIGSYVAFNSFKRPLYPVFWSRC